MNALLRKTLDERAVAWAQVQDIQARRAKAGYESTEEDGETYTRALADVERLSQVIETEERADRLAAVMNTPAGDLRGTNPVTGDDGTSPDVAAAYRGAFAGYLRRGAAECSPDERKLLQGGFQEDPALRALATLTGAAGGYTVPQTFLNRMTEARKAFGGIGQFAETIGTSTGEALLWPKNDDTANVGAILTENTAITEQDTVFGQTTLGSFMYTSKLVRLSYQLLQDTSFNLEAWLAAKLGERIGRAFAAHLATGVGTTTPEGIVTGLTLGTESAGVGVIGYDDLVDIEHAIDPAYRTESTRYIVHDTAVKALRKIKDTTGRPLWAPSVAEGAPSTLNGKPYTVDNGLATLAAGSKSLVYGDIGAAYLVREVAGAQTLRLAERYAEYLQVGFHGFQRLDAKVQDTSAAAVLTAKAA